MKTIVVILLALLTVPGAAIADCHSKEVKRSTETVGLTIDANADAAEIYLGNKFVGTTPLAFDVKPGEYRIELRKPGFQRWERTLHVIQRTRVKATLEAEKR